MIQWLRLRAPNPGGLSSIPGQGTRSHLLQLRVRVPQLRILHVTTKTQCSQINKYNKKEKGSREGKYTKVFPCPLSPLLFTITV